MKKALIFLSILVISLTSHAQSGIGINFCETLQTTPNVTTLTIKQLIECSELTVNNKNYSLDSYSVTIPVSGDVKVLAILGNKFTEKLTSTLKKYNPSKIYFEQVILMDEKGNKIYGASHTVIIKK